MDIYREGLCHLLSSDVGDGVKGETVVDLVVVVEVLSNRVDDEPNHVRVLVHEEGESEVSLQDGETEKRSKRSARR